MLEGRVALVSGAGRGIGREVARTLAGAGAAVVLNDLDADVLDEAVREIAEAGAAAVGCPGDITGRGFADRFVATAADAFGGLDIVVNNAGFTRDAVIQKLTDRDWDDIVEVHLAAPFRLLRAAQPLIAKAARAERSAGRPVHRKVVNVSSVAALHGVAGETSYSAAKAGLIGLTKALAREWGRYRVNVNAVAFGIVDTRLSDASNVAPDVLDAMLARTAFGRAASVAEAAGAVYLLCRPEADYITGQVLVCDGGMEM